MKLVANPHNAFLSEHREQLEAPTPVKSEVYEESTETILSRNNSPDLPFRWSLNPYRGCFHACAYCYARPTHEYWGFGAGTDFESKLVVKPNAAERLESTLNKRSWQGELIVFSGNTDCYQPLEATYKLTRKCLTICAKFQNPVGLITKSSLILRDLDILQELKQRAWVCVYFSIPFVDNEIARKVEPQAPSISKRLEAMQQLSMAGIPTALSIAPIIPGLNEQDIPRILKLAREAGATKATYVLLRLNGNVEPVFLERMKNQFPERIDKISNQLRELRGGALTEKIFFKRHAGKGPLWKVIKQLFELHYRKNGYHLIPDQPIPNTYRRPSPCQLGLFPNT